MILPRTDSLTDYCAFGLRIESEMPLPELTRSDSPAYLGMVPVNVKKSDLSAMWAEYEPVKESIALVGRQVLFRIPDTAIFCVDGDSILFSPCEGASEDKIRLFVLGTCMGIVLMQRQILPLHGSAVAIRGKAYVIAGASGAGKSTLASTLLGRGCSLLSDDLIAVTLAADGTPMVMPAYPQQKMWQESIDRLGMSSAHLTPLYDRETKFAVPVPAKFCNEPLPLAGVYELIKTETTATMKAINGLERFHTLLNHTFRGFLIDRLGLMEWHFGTLARFVNRIDMYRIKRASSGFSAHALADGLLETIH
ncbi:HPr kinase/phosphorylase [Paenibacillus arenilitoris]|uniref:Aldolase n=1 Tax=Paenibacillus arenilitoris TaxID=2772299 RepID=A0A927CR75_9BACL|nr:aldolase [Paenibacillus arenilitoris]MBD2872025.1 aldolase [Paenibacillus arenilitoris]